MGVSLRVLALPSSLLILVASATCLAPSQALQWPYNLPAGTKYFPEDEFLVRRDINVQQRLQTQSAVGVKKMSDDPGEKFYLDYWSFDNDHLCPNPSEWTNQSLFATFDTSLPVHESPYEASRVSPRYLGLKRLALFRKRDFQCPSGTSACTSINRPNSCCGSGSTCQLIQNTGLGDVGCCPAGQSCAGSLSTCPTNYTPCPDNGGGCCLPGYACFDVGCVLTSTVTQVVNPSPSPGSSTTTETLTVTVTPTEPTLQTLTTTVTTILTNTPSTTTTTSTSVITSTKAISLTCSSGFRSCPASLGGGCCATDRNCGSAECPATTTSGSFLAPGRPTTEATTTTTAKSTTSAVANGCPTGFYACSAYYQGGCCQIGRNCGKTSCPTSASTTLVNTNGITVVAPTGSGVTAPGTLLTGACAQGWSTCGTAAGGGCCPSGYACGTSCTATASGAGGSQVGKAAPNGSCSLKPVNVVFIFIACLSSMALGI